MIRYLSSCIFNDNDEFLKEWINKHDNKILLIFNALDNKGEEKIINNTKSDKEILEKIGFNVKVIDLKDYFDKQDKLRELFNEYHALCIMGGNVYVLRSAMKCSGLDKILQELINDDNYLYTGYSAGGCILSKDLKIYDLIDTPLDFYNKGIIYDGLGLIDYVFIPHYQSNYHKVHLIHETVDICKNNNINFKALRDGEVTIERNKL